MTVEVRVIPEGVSGLRKNKGKTTRKRESKPTIKVKGSENYFNEAAKTVTRMQRENAEEHKRLTDKEIRKLLRDQLLANHPNKSGQEIEELVNQTLPAVMRAYRGAPVLAKPEPSAEQKAIWATRETERRRIVRANRQRRKTDQPMSKADRAWVNRNFAGGGRSQ